MNDAGMLVLVILGFATLIVGSNWFVIQYIKRCLSPLLSTIDGQIRTSFWGREASLKGRWEDKDVEVNLDVGGGRYGPPPSIEIYLYYTFPCRIFISRRDFLTRVSERAKILKKISIGDFQFDSNYHISADSELDAKNFLALKRREIIQRLFIQRENYSIEINASYVKISRYFRFSSIFGFKRRLSPIQLIDILRDMVRLTE